MSSALTSCNVEITSSTRARSRNTPSPSRAALTCQAGLLAIGAGRHRNELRFRCGSCPPTGQ